MLDEVQRLGKDPAFPASNFMPYSCSVLTPELIEYAKVNLNETEEVKRQALQEIKEFLKREINLHSELDETVLLCFLRSRKFDMVRTCSMIRKGADFLDSCKNIMDRKDTEAVRRAIESRTIGFLPYRDAKCRAIVYLKSENWDPNEIKVDDMVFGSIVSLHIAAENHVNQVAGFVAILDFKNLTVHQVVAIAKWLIFGIQALQRLLPMLVKEFHIVHTPAPLKAAWKLAKPLLSEKIKKRIIFYKSSNWESLHQRIPPAILPEELGGYLGPFSNEHWAHDVSDIEQKYLRRIRMFMDRKKEGTVNIV